MTVDFQVLGVGMWPLNTARGAANARPAAQLLPARMRGRASQLTAMLVECVDQAARGAQVDPRMLPTIFGSAYGEMGTIVTLLTQLYAADGVLSPARFQASVHNTAAGQLSIALGNRNFSTSLAAGHDTVAMVFVEALAFLQRSPGEVIVACGDEAATPALQPGLDYPPLAAAWVLSNRDGARGLARMTPLFVSGPADDEAPAEPATLRANPCAVASSLALAVLSGEHATVTLNPSLRLEIDARRLQGVEA